MNLILKLCERVKVAFTALPLTDLQYQEVSLGIQSFSFMVLSYLSGMLSYGAFHPTRMTCFISFLT
ncbi:hypothetical protein HanPI659440_Chr12g0470501 [Helianthus annuus]|nr:hypothetical protein HanPI659440_Chr12g0470501 [Helianthus annuus]